MYLYSFLWIHILGCILFTKFVWMINWKVSKHFFKEKLIIKCTDNILMTFGGIALGWSTDGGLKIPWSALALLGKFSNLRLGVYTSYAHEKRIQSLYIHFFHHYFCKINYLNHIRGLNFCTIRAKHVGVIPSSETANTRPVKLNGVKKLSTQEKEMLFSTRVFVFIVRK